MNDVITFDTEEMSGIKVYEPYQLVPEKNPILKRKAVPFLFDKEQAKEISERLKATITKTRAFGVAAPQCGLPYRIFTIGAEGEYTTFFNPEIVSVSKETVVMDEGCLSYAFLVLSVVRPKSVTISFQNEDGEQKVLAFDGLSARIILHEYDHLEGITFDMVAKPLALKMGLKKREKSMRNFARQLIAQRKLQNEIPR